ncbi:nuclear transport factor 2 family protein [Maricaulis sp.]|uniref:nuclear transport factor 2 family protein n=1 Tax=Maricaulis sp. TaxID=1486257 RepID=UPI00262C99FC|nr:nuclear transport factor 2 family protein [Maricaulis sp.]
MSDLHSISAAVLAGFLLATPVLAQDADADIARAYLDAYSALDTERMGELLANEAIFSDRGSFTIEGGPYHYEGRDAILAAIAGFRDDNGLTEIAYDIAMQHEASGQAVYAAEVEARWARPDGGFTVWTGNVVTSVRIENGKVIEHLDMPDYRGGRMSYQADMETPNGTP